LDFPDWLKNYIRGEGKIRFTIIVKGIEFSLYGYGSRLLSLTDPHELVIRKSSYISARTAAIRSTASAADIPRNIVKELKQENTMGIMKIEPVI